eukprot:27387-Chlamydomonas_euryale.AAC.12
MRWAHGHRLGHTTASWRIGHGMQQAMPCAAPKPPPWCACIHATPIFMSAVSADPAVETACCLLLEGRRAASLLEAAKPCCPSWL